MMAQKRDIELPSIGLDICEIVNDGPSMLDENIIPVSIWGQLIILLSRTFLQMSRNRSVIIIQFLHHFASGLLIGGIFFKLGSDGNQTMAIFKYILSVNVFFMYTYVMVPVLVCKFWFRYKSVKKTEGCIGFLVPLEVKMMEREYFNRWYSLKAYYMCFSLAALPLMVSSKTL